MLVINNVSVSIDQKPILNSVDLVVEPATTHVIMGQNGSGKSTLGSTIMGHPRYQITAGTISFNGQDIADMSAEKRAQLGIFLAFQHPLEIPGVRIATFLKEAQQAVTGCQRSVEEFTQELHQALVLLKCDPAIAYRNLNEGFSGGEKKRLELLQMIMLKPSLVLLDEVDSGLDIDAIMLVKKALDRLRELKPQVSVIMITHYHRMLQLISPDYVHVLHGGTIVRSGTMELAAHLEQKGYDGLHIN